MSPELTASLDLLKKQRAEVLEELTKLDLAIAAIAGANSHIARSVKVLDAVSNLHAFVQTTDILEHMLAGSPILENEQLRKNAVISVSKALSKLSKAGKLSVFPAPGFKGNFYGLPSWIDSNGTPISTYMTKYHEKIQWKLRS